LYGQSVRLFADWLTGHGRPATSESLRKHAIASWLAELAHRNVSSNSLATRFAGLRRTTGQRPRTWPHWCTEAPTSRAGFPSFGY
jgi:hypothetical protein